ncbi:hypothetical protein QJS04_geneDACA024776 [Acorus gramineus]|uniref:Uncharacterized protein n=1 Tax=Acorus gramineus TaxID=55184 RepID=A0AAV9BRU2_ACOGR|nr:hypothetical protein QJS04_geneDACA024776 [Acorus gramineus]
MASLAIHSFIYDAKLLPADPDFYRIGYVRSVRAYGVEFKEGPDGFGVFASRDVQPLRRARLLDYTAYAATWVSSLNNDLNSSLTEPFVPHDSRSFCAKDEADPKFEK